GSTTCRTPLTSPATPSPPARPSMALLENAEGLALLETLDMGKPISDSLHIDGASAANSLRWSAEAIDK
ncbi:hypothetical protein, partial [Pseudomonas aeruginosa]